MLTREVLIKSISDKLALLSRSIEYRSILSLHDINVIAETFVGELLNLKNDWNLQNLNTDYGNYPALDLGDLKNKIAIQVTSDSSADKISHTLKVAEKYGLTKKFDSIKVFIIVRKQKSYSKIKIPVGFNFDWKSDIWDWENIVQSLHHLPITKLQSISDFIDQEIKPYTNSPIFSDESSIRIFRQYFNSGMLKDDFAFEGNMDKFLDTLDKHIELINTGKRDNKIVCKPYYEFEHDWWKKVLESTHERFLSLRKLYISCVIKGDIDLNSGFNYFKGNTKIPNIMNDLRKEIISDLNDIFKSIGEKPIQLGY